MTREECIKKAKKVLKDHKAKGCCIVEDEPKESENIRFNAISVCEFDNTCELIKKLNAILLTDRNKVVSIKVERIELDNDRINELLETCSCDGTLYFNQIRVSGSQFAQREWLYDFIKGNIYDYDIEVARCYK